MNDINLWVGCCDKVKSLLLSTTVWLQAAFTIKEDSSRGPLVTFWVNIGHIGLIVVDPLHGSKLKKLKKIPIKRTFFEQNSGL